MSIKKANSKKKRKPSKTPEAKKRRFAQQIAKRKRKKENKRKLKEEKSKEDREKTDDVVETTQPDGVVDEKPKSTETKKKNRKKKKSKKVVAPLESLNSEDRERVMAKKAKVKERRIQMKKVAKERIKQTAAAVKESVEQLTTRAEDGVSKVGKKRKNDDDEDGFSTMSPAKKKAKTNDKKNRESSKGAEGLNKSMTKEDKKKAKLVELKLRTKLKKQRAKEGENDAIKGETVEMTVGKKLSSIKKVGNDKQTELSVLVSGLEKLRGVVPAESETVSLTKVENDSSPAASGQSSEVTVADHEVKKESEKKKKADVGKKTDADRSGSIDDQFGGESEKRSTDTSTTTGIADSSMSSPSKEAKDSKGQSNSQRRQSPSKPPKSKSESLKAKLEGQLDGAKFRFINEQLYTMTSGEAEAMFKKDPAAYRVYHQGYAAQVAKWPINPLDVIIDALKSESDSKHIVDLGCGEAKLAEALASTSPQHRVSSFDLVASNPSVTACDMRHLPLGDASADVVVFCLSLMGTNLVDFVREANRILKKGGLLKIAEVESRCKDLKQFVRDLQKCGFKLINKDLKHRVFFLLDLRKDGSTTVSEEFPLTLEPCYYKKR